MSINSSFNREYEFYEHKNCDDECKYKELCVEIGSCVKQDLYVENR